MSATESPVNQAHRHATNADDWRAQGYFIRALDEHSRAAQAFLSCIDASTDDNTKRTLRLLADEQTRHCQDLQRRINQLRNEGKDPNLPQRQTVKLASQTRASNMQASISRDAGGPIDESFMMLDGQRKELSSSFAQFWKLLEGMLDQLSQPVAFATAPLSVPAAYTSASPLIGSDDGDNDVTRDEETLGEPSDNIDDDWEIDSGGEEMSESFYMIPNDGTRPAVKPNTDDLSKVLEENALLKRKLNAALARVNEMERVIKERVEHEQQLRDSIVQAQKAITSSQIFNVSQSTSRLPAHSSFASPTPQQHISSVSALNLPPARTPSIEAPGFARIVELEEKVRLLQVQDVTNKATIAKYKDRWDRVKESMRKKKASKAAAEVKSSALQNRIEEEVEFE